MVKTPSFQTLDSASGSAPSEPDGHPPGLGRRSDAAPRISRRVPHYSRVERRFGLQVVSRRFVKKQQMQWTLCGAPFAADKDKGPQRGSGRPIPPLVSKIQVATTNAGARAQGGLTPDFLALSLTRRGAMAVVSLTTAIACCAFILRFPSANLERW